MRKNLSFEDGHVLLLALEPVKAAGNVFEILKISFGAKPQIVVIFRDLNNSSTGDKIITG